MYKVLSWALAQTESSRWIIIPQRRDFILQSRPLLRVITGSETQDSIRKPWRGSHANPKGPSLQAPRVLFFTPLLPLFPLRGSSVLPFPPLFFTMCRQFQRGSGSEGTIARLVNVGAKDPRILINWGEMLKLKVKMISESIHVRNLDANSPKFPAGHFYGPVLLSLQSKQF